MIRKLRVKFVCINMLIVLILLSIMLGLVLSSTKQRMAADSIQILRGLAAAPTAPFQPNDRSSETKLPFFRLTLSKEGELLSCEGGSYDLSDEAFLQELIASVRSSGMESGVLGEYHLRYLARETPREQILVFTDISSEIRAVRYLFTSCLLVGLAGLALFLGVSILLARWAVKPVEQAWAQQKQFVADASHELKTPLTVILTDTELLQSGSCAEADRQRFLGSIRTMGEQMRGLVEELLSLTRADNTNAVKEQQPMDWSRCVSDALLPFEPVFYEKGLSLEAELEEGVFVKGNEAQLRQAAEILLDNAQKYSLPGTAARVRLCRQGRSAVLSVENRGEEIPADELEKIFSRFYRLDKARSTNHSYGLGLAIAKQIAENHKGKIWAESEGGRNRFSIQLSALSKGV